MVSKCLLYTLAVSIIVVFAALAASIIMCAQMHSKPLLNSIFGSLKTVQYVAPYNVVAIPKHIHQTWKTAKVPDWATHHVRTWKRKNPQV